MQPMNATICLKYLKAPVLFFCLLSAACGERETAPPAEDEAAAQYAYFPLRIGQYRNYQVDSVVYDFAVAGGTQRDSSRTFLREVVTDTFRDQTRQLVFTVEQYERKNANQPWQIRRIGTAARTPTQAIRTDNNLRFLKLVFPLDRRSEWNGNLWIDADREIEVAGERIKPFANWQYEVDTLDKPAQIGRFRFDSVLTVTEANQTNIIERRFSRVKYAKNVGLAFREQEIFDSQYCNQTPVPADCSTRPWRQKAQKGYSIRQILLDYNR